MIITEDVKDRINASWVAGFFDGDGCVSITNRIIRKELRQKLQSIR